MPFRRFPSSLRALGLSLALSLGPLALSVEPAGAHAIVLDSLPALNASLPGPDVAISLHFNSRVDHERSRLTLRAPDGKTQRIPITGGQPDRIEGQAAGLASGKYRLRWQVLAVDGHITSGDIPFQIKAP